MSELEIPQTAVDTVLRAAWPAMSPSPWTVARSLEVAAVTRTVLFCPGTPWIAPRGLALRKESLREAVWSPASVRGSSTSSFALLPTQLAGVPRSSVVPGARWLVGSVGTRGAPRTAPGLVIAPDLATQTVPQAPTVTHSGEQSAAPLIVAELFEPDPILVSEIVDEWWADYDTLRTDALKMLAAVAACERFRAEREAKS